MEEKRLPIIDEEENAGMVCEPVAEVAGPLPKSVDGVTKVHDWIDDLDWDRFPNLGPSSEEEAIARIDSFEEDLKNGQVKWISSEGAWAHLSNLFTTMTR